MKKDLMVERLFACDAVIGRPQVPYPGPEPDLEDMSRRFGHFPIQRALVRSAAGYYAIHDLANQTLIRHLAGQDAYEGVYLIDPLDVQDHLERLMQYRMRSVWMKPHNNYRPYSFFPWCCGELYKMLEEKKLPVLLEWGSFVPNELHEAMNAFPGMRVILLQVPRLGRLPMVESLMELHKELYVCLHTRFSVFGGYPALCSRFGSHRFVWGCGYPDAEEGAGVTGLFYSGLDQAALEAVAHGNIERLLSEVEK